MMLSNVDIEKALNNGSLKIEPFNPKAIRGAGVTMHLGYNMIKPLPGAVVDIRSGKTPEYQDIVLKEGECYKLMPQEFLLGETLEAVTVGNNLGFFIEGRSTLARLGLTIVKTAMLVEPGHRNRRVTLELGNHGPNPILLYPKMKIARVALFELKTPTTKSYDDTGKYRGQSGVGRPILVNEFMEE